MSSPRLTEEEIRAIVAAASAAIGVDLYTEETPGMRAIRRFNDLIMECLADLPISDQAFRIAIDYNESGNDVTVSASAAAMTAIEARYPRATWQAIMNQFDQEAYGAG